MVFAAGSGSRDVIFDPRDANVVYAQLRAKGIYKSTDGGQTWTVLQNGVPVNSAASYGRLAMSPVIDRLNQRIASAVSFASQACGLALMLALPDEPAVLYAGSILFGLSVGNVITMPALIVQREFAARSFGLVIGLTSMVGYTLLAFGPTLLGVARDATGGYGAALVLCIVLQLTGAVIVGFRPR